MSRPLIAPRSTQYFAPELLDIIFRYYFFELLFRLHDTDECQTRLSKNDRTLRLGGKLASHLSVFLVSKTIFRLTYPIFLSESRFTFAFCMNKRVAMKNNIFEPIPDTMISQMRKFAVPTYHAMNFLECFAAVDERHPTPSDVKVIDTFDFSQIFFEHSFRPLLQMAYLANVNLSFRGRAFRGNGTPDLWGPIVGVEFDKKRNRLVALDDGFESQFRQETDILKGQFHIFRRLKFVQLHPRTEKSFLMSMSATLEWGMTFKSLSHIVMLERYRRQWSWVLRILGNCEPETTKGRLAAVLVDLPGVWAIEYCQVCA